MKTEGKTYGKTDEKADGKARKSSSPRYAPGTVGSGHRLKSNNWAMFKVLAQSHGITANVALNRLVDYAIMRGFIPEYIPNPQLPPDVPPKEQEARVMFESKD